MSPRPFLRRHLVALLLALLVVGAGAGVAVAGQPPRLTAGGRTAVAGTDASAVFRIGDRTIRQVRYRDGGTLVYTFALHNGGTLPLTVTGLAPLHPEPRLFHYRDVTTPDGSTRFTRRARRLAGRAGAAADAALRDALGPRGQLRDRACACARCEPACCTTPSPCASPRRSTPARRGRRSARTRRRPPGRRARAGRSRLRTPGRSRRRRARRPPACRTRTVSSTITSEPSRRSAGTVTWRSTSGLRPTRRNIVKPAMWACRNRSGTISTSRRPTRSVGSVVAEQGGCGRTDGEDPVGLVGGDQALGRVADAGPVASPGRAVGGISEPSGTSHGSGGSPSAWRLTSRHSQRRNARISGWVGGVSTSPRGSARARPRWCGRARRSAARSPAAPGPSGPARTREARWRRPSAGRR